MDQYKEIKEGYKDCLLFYRLGDFTNCFMMTRGTASHELELTFGQGRMQVQKAAFRAVRRTMRPRFIFTV